MNTLEILLSNRWILKRKNKELYYKTRDGIPMLHRFLAEKLGYQLTVNPYLIKLDKIPARPEAWMGNQNFAEKKEYIFFCLILMFLEDKEAEEQFVLSELSEFVQGNYIGETVDWTIFRNRRSLIRVIQYCLECGMLEINDGSEEEFSRDASSEVLYTNTGVSRYFMRSFTQDIMDYQSYQDFLKEEWISVNEDRGIVRRQRVYRQLLMNAGIYRTAENEEDFDYLRHYHGMIAEDLEKQVDCELQVYRNSAFVVLGEESSLGRVIPENNMQSDILLLLCGLVQEEIRQGRMMLSADSRIHLTEVEWTQLLLSCRDRFGVGFGKTYRNMTTSEFCAKMTEYLQQRELLCRDGAEIQLYSAVGKLQGRYPDDFEKEGKKV